jgi:hypothetical protein
MSTTKKILSNAATHLLMLLLQVTKHMALFITTKTPHRHY